jgi:hypothetical protein
MQKALATFRNGHLELATPVDWPEGTTVEVIPLRQKIGMTEAEWPTTPDAIQSLLRRMDEATLEDDGTVDFDWHWPEWDQYQKQATRNSWDDLEKLF